MLLKALPGGWFCPSQTAATASSPHSRVQNWFLKLKTIPNSICKLDNEGAGWSQSARAARAGAAQRGKDRLSAPGRRCRIRSPNDAGQWPEEVLGVWFPLSLLLGCPLGMSYDLLVWSFVLCAGLLHLLVPDNSSKAAKYYLKCGNVYKSSAKESAWCSEGWESKNHQQPLEKRGAESSTSLCTDLFQLLGWAFLRIQEPGAKKSWKAQFQAVSVLVFEENFVWFSTFLYVPSCCGVIADEIPKHVCSEHEIFGFWQCSNGIIVENILWKHYTPPSLRWILFACSFPGTLMLIFASL